MSVDFFVIQTNTSVEGAVDAGRSRVPRPVLRFPAGAFDSQARSETPSARLYWRQSPQCLQAHRYHEQLGHEVLYLNADGAGLTQDQHRATLELFQSDIAPVLRREIPSRPFPPRPA